MVSTKLREQKAKQLIKEGQYQDALSEYQVLISEEPNNPGFYNVAGDIYKTLGLNEDAMNSYKGAIDIYTSETLYNNAIALCKKVIRISSEDDEIYNTLGKLYSELNLQNEALNNFIEYANRMRRQNNITSVIKTYEYIKDKFSDNTANEHALQELYLVQGIEAAKKLGPLKTTEVQIEALSQTKPMEIPSSQGYDYLTKAMSLLKDNSIYEEPALKEAELSESKHTTDKLTGIYDRNSLVKFLEKNVELAEREGFNLSLFILDINGFKAINEKVGEENGDKILQEIVKILKNTSTENDTLFRYNGDEFAILSSGTSRQESELKQAKIKELVETVKYLGSVSLSVKIDFSMYPEDAKTASFLLEQALRKIDTSHRVPESKGKKAGIQYDIEPHCLNFIGREDELQMLDKLLKQGNKTVLVSGGVGVGKTRLLEEFIERSRFNGVQVFNTNCYTPATPYAPFKSLFKQLVSGNSKNLLPDVQPLLDKIIPVFLPEAIKQTGKDKHGIKELPLPLAEYSEKEMKDDVVKFLTAISKTAPILLVIDNFEFATNSTVELIAYIAKNLKKFNGMICCSVRDNFTKALGEIVNPSITIEINPLPAEVLETFIGNVVQSDTSASEIAKSLHKMSNGNPLILDALLSRRVGDLNVIDNTQLYSTQYVFDKTIALLDKPSQDVLSKAALLGDEFEIEFLSIVSGKNEGYLADVLDKAENINLIRKFNNSTYTFKHIEIRNAFKKMIEGHSEVYKKNGELMEMYYGIRIDEFLWKIAYSFAKSGDNTKAVSYGIWAGDEAQKIYAYKDALHYYEESLDRALVLDEIALIYSGIIDTCLAMEDWALCEKYISLYEAKIDDKANVSLKKGIFFTMRGQIDSAITNLLCANEVYRDKNVKPFILKSSLLLAELYNRNGEQESALKFSNESLLLAEELSQKYELGISLLLAGNVSCEAKKINEAFEYYYRAFSVFKSIGAGKYLLETITKFFTLPLDWSKIGILIQKGNIVMEM